MARPKIAVFVSPWDNVRTSAGYELSFLISGSHSSHDPGSFGVVSFHRSDSRSAARRTGGSAIRVYLPNGLISNSLYRTTEGDSRTFPVSPKPQERASPAPGMRTIVMHGLRYGAPGIADNTFVMRR